MREWIVEGTIRIYAFLLPIAGIALVISLLVLLPMTAWRKTRVIAGFGLLISSYVLGVTTWFLGAAVTFGSFGWLGLIIGLLFLGLGVVPLGIIGAFFKLNTIGLSLTLCVLLAITLVARFAGMSFLDRSGTCIDDNNSG